MKFLYNVSDRPPMLMTFFYGVGWWLTLLPIIVTMAAALSSATGAHHFIYYLRILMCTSGIAQLLQFICGHRLPLVVGPASVLLVGVLAASIDTNTSSGAVYTAMIVGAIVLFITTITGGLDKLLKKINHEMIVLVFLLIALSLLPIVRSLLFSSQQMLVENLLFFLSMLFILLISSRLFKGWGSAIALTLVLLVGSISYYALGLSTLADTTIIQGQLGLRVIDVEFNLILIAVYLISYLALSINEIASIGMMSTLVEEKENPNAIKRGILTTCFVNAGAAIFGSIGVVNFSLTHGLVVSSRCASRYPFLVTSLLLLITSFCTPILTLLVHIPNTIVAAVLLYLLAMQVGVGLMKLGAEQGGLSYDTAFRLALPLLVAILSAFIPKEISLALPYYISAVISNGFVMGFLAMILMNFIYKTKRP